MLLICAMYWIKLRETRKLLLSPCLQISVLLPKASSKMGQCQLPIHGMIACAWIYPNTKGGRREKRSRRNQCPSTLCQPSRALSIQEEQTACPRSTATAPAPRSPALLWEEWDEPQLTFPDPQSAYRPHQDGEVSTNHIAPSSEAHNPKCCQVAKPGLGITDHTGG